MSSKKKYDSLISMSESEFFTLEMLMHHLKEVYEVDGVRDVMINRLYKYPEHNILYYIPELCNIYLVNPKPALMKFLIDKGSRNLNFYLLVGSCLPRSAGAWTPSAQTQTPSAKRKYYDPLWRIS